MTSTSWQQAGLGFVAGYSDTVGFIALGGLFVAHVTGNLVLAGASVFHFSGDNVIPNLLMLPIFLCVIGLLTMASKFSFFRRLAVEQKTQALLLFQLVFSVAFWACGALMSGGQFPVHGIWPVFCIGALGVAALSAQNVLTRLTGSSAPATTVMTGNLTQAAVSVFSLMVAAKGAVSDDLTKQRSQLTALTPSVVGFFLGAALAAPLTFIYHFDSMALACLVLGALIVQSGASSPARQPQS